MARSLALARVTWGVMIVLASAVPAFPSAAQTTSRFEQQTSDSAPPDAIVVTGTRVTRNSIQQFTNNVSVPIDGQLASFRNPICPAAFGLPRSYDRALEQRIRAVAAQAGLAIGGADCGPNVVIIVADKSRDLIEQLNRRRPDLFAGVDYNQVRQMLTTVGPVRTWTSVEPRGADGRPLQRVQFIDYNGVLMRPGTAAWVNPSFPGSRIKQAIRPDLVSSFILFDIDSIDGMTLTQLADYAAMRTLAQTRYDPRVGNRSILSLFSGASADAPSQMTVWDSAYLQGLYRTDNTRAAAQQRADIAGVMQRELRDPAAGQHTAKLGERQK